MDATKTNSRKNNKILIYSKLKILWMNHSDYIKLFQRIPGEKSSGASCALPDAFDKISHSKT